MLALCLVYPTVHTNTLSGRLQNSAQNHQVYEISPSFEILSNCTAQGLENKIFPLIKDIFMDLVQYQVHEDIFNWHRRGSSPEHSGLATLKMFPSSGELREKPIMYIP
jgi:hypothetical protein